MNKPSSTTTTTTPKKKRQLSLIDDDPTCGLELRIFHQSPGATSISPPPRLSPVLGMDHHHNHNSEDEDYDEEQFMDARVDSVPILTDEVVVPIDGQQIRSNKSYEIAIAGLRISVSTKKCHILMVLGMIVASMGTVLIALNATNNNNSLSGGLPSDSPVQTMEPSAYYKALESILEPATRNDPHIAKFWKNSTLWNDPMSPQYLALEWMAFRDHQFLANHLHDANAIQQRFALVTFFYMASIQLYNDDEHDWLKPGRSECQFPGITCNARDQVIKIEMVRTAMTGYLPLEMGWLVHLEHLNLQENKLNGAIPPGLLHLSNLKHLDLGSNHMGGPVESLPPNLEFLSLEHNRFQGSIPTFPLSLESAKLSHNRWSGPLPEFQIHNNLKFLDVADNTRINGTIPTSIGHLTKLQSLAIAQTQLEGELPTQIGLLSSLEEISMGMTKLQGSLPDEFFELSQLKWLIAVHHQLEGPLSPLIAKLKNLNVVNLTHGSLTGPLPTQAIASLKNLVWLQLADNQFTGHIEADLATVWGLQKIWLHGNEFQGSLPNEFCALPAAQLDFRTDCKTGDVTCSCCTLCY